MPKDNANRENANRGQERSAEARRQAQEQGSDAHGRGGNPNKGVEDDTVVEPSPEPVMDGEGGVVTPPSSFDDGS